MARQTSWKGYLKLSLVSCALPRDAKCALPALENEGGSIVGPLTIACLLAETARQTLWLEELGA